MKTLEVDILREKHCGREKPISLLKSSVNSSPNPLQRDSIAVVIELTRGWSCAQNQRLEEHVPSSIHREHENWNFKKRVIHANVSITSITMDFCSLFTHFL